MAHQHDCKKNLCFEFNILDDNPSNIEFELNTKDIDSQFYNYISNKAIAHFNHRADLPKKGVTDLLYIVNNKEVYIWDSPNNKYFMINSMGAVGDGKFSLSQNGVLLSEFTANQDEDLAVNLLTPTKVSDLDNDSKFIAENDNENLDIDFSNFFN